MDRAKREEFVNELLSRVRDLPEQAIDAQREVVREARKQKITWQEIGQVFGISRQAAWERFHDHVD